MIVGDSAKHVPIATAASGLVRGMRDRPSELRAATTVPGPPRGRPALGPATAASLLALGADPGDDQPCAEGHVRPHRVPITPTVRSARRGAATVTLLLMAAAGLAAGNHEDSPGFARNGSNSRGSVSGGEVMRGEPRMHERRTDGRARALDIGEDDMSKAPRTEPPHARPQGSAGPASRSRWIPAAAAAAAAATALAAQAADNHVMALTAVGQYMTVPHSPSLAAHDALTVEFWLLFQNPTGFGRIGKSAPSDCQWGVAPRVGTGASEFWACGAATDVLGFTVPTGRWVHVASTWSQSTGIASVYLDGDLVKFSAGSNAPMQATTYPVFIGMQPGYGDSQLFGRIDNLRIWNVARTAQEINALRFTEIAAANAGSYPGLAASYTFENGASDSTGLNPGTLMGGASIVIDNSFLPNPCEGDIIADGRVDGVDLAAVLAQWGQPATGAYDADLNDDGTINGVDLSMVLNGWGPCGG